MITARRFGLFLLLLLLAATIAAAWLFYQKWQQEERELAALQTPLTQAARLHIPRGTTLAGIAELAAEQLPVSKRMFIALARRQNVATSLKAGVYQFSAGDTLSQVLEDIAAGKVRVVKIALIEGRTFADWRQKLSEDARLKQILPRMSDAEIIATLNIPAEHLEGMFLPDTYFFHYGDSDLSILRRAHERLVEVLDKHWQEYQAREDNNTLFTSPYEALILASIVEKETGKAEERPRIAAVFINRLHANMRLQADPTVIYGLGDAFDGNLTRAHLRQQDTPYNTYMRGGLPPTPIAMVGEAAIHAVFNPLDSKEYYFVAKGDGTGSHYFSKNLREHNNAVNRYQRKRKQ